MNGSLTLPASLRPQRFFTVNDGTHNSPSPPAPLRQSGERGVRLLPFASADGARNMAVDEALLESAVAGIASLRFYAWSEPTVSLGYFQPQSVREAARLAPLPFVRRPSGGMTLVHDRELTYALALPAGAPWQTAAEKPWLCRMHTIIGAALENWGVRAAAASCAITAHSDSPLCFLHTTPGDLLLGEAKVVGSAQRRQRGALLQHGAILLQAPQAAPALPGVADLTSRHISLAELAQAITKCFARDTGWTVTESAWQAAENARVEALATTKYTADEWNQKR